jgi:hypothetical protein
MDELTLLRATRSDVTAPSADVLSSGERALFEKIGSEAEPATSARPSARRSTIRWTGIGALGAATLVAALVLSNVVGGAGWRGGADPAAASALSDAALATISTADAAVGPGQYLLVNTKAVNGASTDGISYLAVSDSQLYVPADREDEWVWDRSASAPYQTFGTESARVAEADLASRVAEWGEGRELLRAPGGGFYGSPSAVSEGALADLPRDPTRLLNYIYRVTLGTGQSPDGEALVYIADRLRSGIVPADLRAALYRAAALIPGVEIVEKQATLDGRTGVAIGRVETGSDTRQDIIIDPATGLLIGERQVQLKAGNGYPAGTTVSFTSIATSVVDQAPDGGTLNGDLDSTKCVPLGNGGFQC